MPVINCGQTVLIPSLRLLEHITAAISPILAPIIPTSPRVNPAKITTVPLSNPLANRAKIITTARQSSPLNRGRIVIQTPITQIPITNPSPPVLSLPLPSPPVPTITAIPIPIRLLTNLVTLIRLVPITHPIPRRNRLTTTTSLLPNNPRRQTILRRAIPLKQILPSRTSTPAINLLI